jgi:hypothetical protein
MAASRTTEEKLAEAVFQHKVWSTHAKMLGVARAKEHKDMITKTYSHLVPGSSKIIAKVKEKKTAPATPACVPATPAFAVRSSSSSSSNIAASEILLQAVPGTPVHAAFSRNFQDAGPISEDALEEQLYQDLGDLGDLDTQAVDIQGGGLTKKHCR